MTLSILLLTSSMRGCYRARPGCVCSEDILGRQHFLDDVVCIVVATSGSDVYCMSPISEMMYCLIFVFVFYVADILFVLGLDSDD